MWNVNIARRETTPFHAGVVNLRRVVSFDEGDSRTMLRFSGGSHVYISAAEVIPQFVEVELLPSTIRTLKLSSLPVRGHHRYEGRVNTRAIPYVIPVNILDEDEELSYHFPTPKGDMWVNEIVHDQFFLYGQRMDGMGGIWINPTYVDFVAFGEKLDLVSVAGEHFRIKPERSFRENMGLEC